jgi:hypothetical protein
MSIKGYMWFPGLLPIFFLMVILKIEIVDNQQFRFENLPTDLR